VVSDPPRARKSFERPGGQDCASFLASARLKLGGQAIVSNCQLDHLTYTVVPGKNARIVHVAPPTDWRIDSSLAALEG
jgi:hypothetical protein